MPCSKDHFVPLLDEIAARDPDHRPPVPKTMARAAGRNWGGRRPGAGAPKGNMNGYKHGKYSVRHRRLIHILAQIPEAREALMDIGLRRRKQQALAVPAPLRSWRSYSAAPATSSSTPSLIISMPIKNCWTSSEAPRPGSRKSPK
jgi:hypothetical protein